MNFEKLAEFKKEMDQEKDTNEESIADYEGKKFAEIFDKAKSEGESIGINELDKMRRHSRAHAKLELFSKESKENIKKMRQEADEQAKQELLKIREEKSN